MSQPIKKGIILAAGDGTRLRPLTAHISKQLLPVYDKPMIYYPLAVLMNLHIRDILIIVNQRDAKRYQALLGDGSSWGINIQFKVQASPKGIPDAFIVGEEFIAGDNVALILGDNIFYPLDKITKAIQTYSTGAMVFGYEVDAPEKYGIAVFDDQQNVIDLVEKPKSPPSNIAITGLYFFDSQSADISQNLKPSGRGELEITDVMRHYIKNNNLELVNLTSADSSWFDCGQADDLMKAANFIMNKEQKTGRKIGSLEEIAYLKKYITVSQLSDIVSKMPLNNYRQYLEKLLTSKKL